MITLQFVGSDGLSSRLIELKGGGPYSHVDIVLPTGELLGARDDEVGEQPSGVYIRPADYEDWEKVARVDIDCDGDQEAAFYDFVHQQIGKPYDHTAIIGFILNRGWNDTDSWFCSELATAGLVHANVFKCPLATAANKIDPDTAFALASTIGTVKIVKN